MNEIFASFSPSDKVPGFYGAVQYGTSGQTTAGLPIALLLVGLVAPGASLQPDTQLAPIFQQSDVDTLAAPGSELACMAYQALLDAPNTPIYLASAKPASGAIAATVTLVITGTWNTGGPLLLRIAGVPISVQVGPSDTAALVATNVALAINGASSGRLPLSATASTNTVVIVCKSPGVRGGQHVIFSDMTQAPPGFSGSLIGATWTLTTAYTTAQYVTPPVANGLYYKATTAGTSAGVAPTFPTVVGTTVTDGTVVWTCWGPIVAQNTTTGVMLGGGSGLESYTNLANTLQSVKFGRHAFAANDATSTAAWRSSVDTQANITSGIRQHVVIALNSTIALAESVGQTTLNDPRFQVPFQQNSEAHPSRIAASVAATRALQEASDPDASYDGWVLANLPPQTQPADVPIHPQQVAMLNNSVTPLTTQFGQVQIVRSITTKSLTLGAPDYSTLDTGMATVPDFVLDQLAFYWSDVFANPATGNTRVQDNPLSSDPSLPTGVAYPNLWTGAVTAQLTQMEAGRIPGGCAPILYKVAQFPPSTSWDAVNKRLLSVVPCWPRPANHQMIVAIAQAS